MKTTTALMVGLLAITAIFVGYAQCDQPQEPQPQNYHPSPEPYPVVLQVGEVFKVCWSGEVICGVTYPICDDVKVVDVVETPVGLGFKGISPGTTLCSVQSANGARRVFRITVQ